MLIHLQSIVRPFQESSCQVLEMMFNDSGSATHEGDAGIPDGIMNSTACTRSQTLWRTSKLED